MEGEDRKWFGQLTLELLTYYHALGMYLQDLPIPISLPRMENRAHMEIPYRGALDAYKAIKDMPGLQKEAKGLLVDALFEWLVACDQGFAIHGSGHDGWRLEAMNRALERLHAALLTYEMNFGKG